MPETGRRGAGTRRVALEHRDVVGVGEAVHELGRERSVDLDGQDSRAALGDRRGERARPGAELDDVIGRRDPGVGREVTRDRGAFEEVLPELSSVRPPGS